MHHVVANTVAVANDIEFTLENLGYEFPKFPVPQGETMDSFLEKVVWAGARYRYGKISGNVFDHKSNTNWLLSESSGSPAIS